MDLATVLGLAMSALGLGGDLAKTIKDRLAKKLVVTPNLIETTSRHWDSTNSVIIQNKSDKPLFSVQIVFWHDKNQSLEFKFEKVKKEAQIENLIINYGVVIFRGEASDEKVVIIEILRLLPGESIELDLQIEKRGSVRMFPASYDEKQSKQVLNNKKELVYPFNPPFNMSLDSIVLNLRKAS
jgi:hypothetical protein